MSHVFLHTYDMVRKKKYTVDSPVDQTLSYLQFLHDDETTAQLLLLVRFLQNLLH